MPDTGLFSRIYKEFLKVSNRKTDPNKRLAKGLDTSTKMYG